MKPRTLSALLVAVVLSLTIASAFGAGGGRLHLYLVNSGPETAFYNESVGDDGNCAPFQKPASLSISKGTGVQYDSPGYAFDPDFAPSTFSYTVPAGEGFTVPANRNAVVLKQWAFSGDGTCPPPPPSSQLGDQTVDWRVYCSGTCGSNVSLTGPGQVAKPGWQAFDVPAGTGGKLFNDHSGPASAVNVRAGDVITLELSADTWVGMQWSASSGAGVSSLSILGK